MIQRLDKIFDLKTIAPSGVKKAPRQQRMARRSNGSDFSEDPQENAEGDDDHNLVVRPCDVMD